MKVKSGKNNLEIKLSLIEKILSLHGSFRISKENVVSIKEGRPSLYTWFMEWRIPGTFVPGIIKAGTYYTRSRGKEFWYWTRFRKYTYTVKLKNMKYNQIIISTNEKLNI